MFVVSDIQALLLLETTLYIPVLYCVAATPKKTPTKVKDIPPMMPSISGAAKVEVSERKVMDASAAAAAITGASASGTPGKKTVKKGRVHN